MALLNRKREVGSTAADSLSQQEVTFLLKTLHDCKFDGKDVLLLADVVNKLQNYLKSE